MSNTPPRPRWDHKEVKTEAAAHVFSDVKEWAISMAVVSADVADAEFRALVTLAFLESDDCYEAARYFDDVYDWPVNGELVRIIDRAYQIAPRLTAPFVHAWVMKHNVRFPATSGSEVRVQIGDAEVTGTCIGSVYREARGFVELRNGKVLPVDAEEVVKVLKTKRTGSKPTPPTGGTPIAPRAGALLKKANAA
ncbi:hypothetical protein [Phaeobacter phage MD18]|nr:hypothetical protein [Phaeobacter phage MD18]